MLLLTLIIPLAAAAVISLLGRWPNLREAVSLFASSALFYAVVQLYIYGREAVYQGVELLRGVPIAFAVEPLGLIFALVASFLWIVTSLYSIGYMRSNKEYNQTRFYAWFALSLACAMGIAFAGNLLTLFIFYEMLTLCTYPLVTHSGTEASKKAGRTYLGILLATSVGLLLVAVVCTWNLTGTLTFTPGGIMNKHIGAGTIAILFFLYVYGVGKTALMPIHRWLPAAMVAPTPVSALLHAVAVVKAGVFTLIKIVVYILGVDFLKEIGVGGWLVYVAGATVILASLIALRQDNLKRLLAYSTISQLAYIVMAVATFAKEAIMVAAFHIAAHGIGKITLFFAAGAIYTASKKKRLSELAGIGKRMPWTMAAFTVGALSMVAVPPMAGFLSKWHLLSSAWEEGNYFVVGTLVVSTMLNVMYFMPIVFLAYFRPETTVHVTGNLHDHGEAPVIMVIALMVTALCTIGLFVWPGVFWGLAERVAG